MPHMPSTPARRPRALPSDPGAIRTASAVIRALPVADARWDLLLVCAAAYILTTVGRIHQLFPTLEVFRPALLVGVASILVYLADGQRVRRLKWTMITPTRCLLALLLWTAMTIPFALVQSNSYELVVNNFAKTVAMTLVVAGCIRGTRDVERLAGAYAAGAAMYSAVVLLRFDPAAGGEDWRLGDLYYYDANDLATFVVTALPLALYFLHAGRRVVTQLAAGGALVIMTLALVRTGSRGGFVAFVAMGLFVLARYSAIRLRHRLGAAALVLLVVAAAATDQYWQQMTTILEENDYNRTAETGRLQIWARGIGYMRDYPIFGVGAGNFSTAEGTISPLAARQAFGRGVRWNAPHNSYIQAGAELGVPGLILFVALIATSLTALARLRRAPRAAGVRRGQLGDALTAAVVGYAVGAFFLTLAFAEMLYALIALAVGLVKAAPAAAPRRAPHDVIDSKVPRLALHRASH